MTEVGRGMTEVGGGMAWGWVWGLVLTRRETRGERGCNGSVAGGHGGSVVRGRWAAMREWPGLLLRDVEVDFLGASGWQIQLHDAVVVGVGDD